MSCAHGGQNASGQMDVPARTAQALQRRGFECVIAKDANEAAQTVLASIPENARVGIGGSMTIRELGIIEKMEERGNEVFHHWKPGLTEETDRKARKTEGLSDLYLTSANAITEQGDIINIDGIGNRVAHMVFGPASVIIVAGVNKIVPDIDKGIRRSKDVAAVLNAKRIGSKAPCATAGKCVDCDSPARICRVITIMQYRPWQTNVKVVLVDEPMGV